MSSFEEFLAMGGYATYVWSAYGITAVVVIANIVAPVVERRALYRRVARQARLDRRSS